MTPSHGAFAFYYQVAFMLTIGICWALCSMAFALGAVGMLLDRADHPRMGEAAKRAARILVYGSVAAGVHGCVFMPVILLI